mgnify:CR=1 FL=1
MINRRDVFQAIADPTRRSILNLVSTHGPMNPGVIAENYKSSRQTISNHIRILTECELLTFQQKGREIIYSFNPRKMKEVDDYLSPFRKQWELHFNKMDELLQKMKNNK